MHRVVPCRCFMLLLLVATALAGCGRKLMPTPALYVGADPATFEMVPETRRSNVVEILYATDRLPRDETKTNAPPAHRSTPVVAYSADRSTSLAFGVARVRIGPESLTWDEVVDASVTAQRDLALKFVDADELVRTPRVPWYVNLAETPDLTPEQHHVQVDESLASFRALLEDRLAESESKNVYVFIHGFNNTFEYAAESLAELWHFLGRPGVAVLYSWPSGKAGVFGYAADYESSDFTVGHFKLFLKAMAASGDVERVHLLSHSRGAGVLSTALRELRIEYHNQGKDPSAELKIGNAVFAAADLDMDVAIQRVGAENTWDACERITVYAEAGDTALNFATGMFKGSERVGQRGPRAIKPYHRVVYRLIEDQLSLIYNDEKTGLMGHAYYVDNPKVSSDLILLLRDNAAPGSPERPLKRDPTGLWLIEPGYPNIPNE